jgi:hypothetical protein
VGDPGVGGLGDSLRREIRTAVLSALPPVAAAELANEDLVSLLISYGSWRARFVPATPRQVHESRELQQHPRRGQYEPALRRILDEVNAGEDLTPRLSGRVHTAHLPESASRGRPRHEREDRDLLLADWGLHHLHLGSRWRKGRYTRTDDVLIAYFTATDAYLVDIANHAENWAAVRLLEIIVCNWPQIAEGWRSRGATGLSQQFSDEERLALRNAGVTVLVEVDGAVYCPVPAGQCLAGTPLAVARHVNEVMHQLNTIDGWFLEQPEWLQEHVAAKGHRLPPDAVWAPRVHDGRYGLVEGKSGIFVPLGKLARP